jgi:subtilisin family serine protease
MSPASAAPPELPFPIDIKAVVKQTVPAYAQDRILVRFKPGTAASSKALLHKQAGGKLHKTIPQIGLQIIKVPHGRVKQKLKAYRANPNVEFAELDQHRILVIPNEGIDAALAIPNLFTEQWGLNNTGQLLIEPTFGLPILSGAADADIDAPEAWDIHTGDASIKLAVLDTGIDCAAVDLAGKCVEQISFVTDYSATLNDIAAHGTHVAGIAAANSDNNKGTAGVGWNTSLGNLKTCFEYELDLFPPLGYFVIVGVCPVSASAAAITYAADNGYHVINMSYGSDVIDEFGEPIGASMPPNAESAAVTYAWEQGVVIVAAAGNDANMVQLYPAANNEVIAVAATNYYDDKAAFSTFSNNWVSMMAPGENILSTLPDDSCFLIPGFIPGVDDCANWQSGTSMASPHVAGAAALLWAQLYPGQTPSTCVASNGSPCNTVVRSILENSADVSGALAQNFLSWSQNGRLNIFNMLNDGDGDSITSPTDNCPDIANFDQTDTDTDGQGDACDVDDDNDGLTDDIEITLGTNPLLADSDGDTLSDFDEVNLDGDPTNYTPGIDTNPNLEDTDGDSINDNLDPIPVDFNFNNGDLAPWNAPDGNINAADTLIATSLALGIRAPGTAQLQHGDVYPPGAPDGEINTQDLLLIMQMVLQ